MDKILYPFFTRTFHTTFLPDASRLLKKLRQSTHASKEAMIFCVYELCGEEEDEQGTETWLNKLDRGGLWHANDMAYALFYAMEVEVRSHLTPSKAGRMTDGTTELFCVGKS